LETSFKLFAFNNNVPAVTGRLIATSAAGLAAVVNWTSNVSPAPVPSKYNELPSAAAVCVNAAPDATSPTSVMSPEAPAGMQSFHEPFS